MRPRTVASNDYFGFVFFEPGASDFASFAPVSFLMSPGAFSDLPGPLGGVMWPGAMVETPVFGVPLLPAWAVPMLIVAKTSAAAQIEILLRAILVPSVAV